MKQDRVVFTSVFNEDDLLPIWLSYYSRFFTNIVVIDHISTGDSIRKAQKKFKFDLIYDNNVVITQLDGRAIDSTVDRLAMMQYQKGFLQDYKWVLYAHADEFVVAHPKKFSGLDEYIDKCKKDYVFCIGRSVLHFPAKEKPLDFTKPLLKQRTYWWNDNHSSHKPLLSRVPLDWVNGYHSLGGITDEQKRDSMFHAYDDLYMIHLVQADLNLYQRRGRHSVSLSWFNKGKDDKSVEKIPEEFKIF